MREYFWGVYYSIAYKKFYYLAHQRRSQTLLFAAKCICGGVSIISILIWGIARSMPVLWACLIALAQLSQTMLEYLPWSKQLNALNYLLPSLDELLLDVYEDWLRYGCDEKDNRSMLAECAVKYDRKYFELENRYTAGVWFPMWKSVCKRAETACDHYFDVRFPAQKGDDPNEEKAEPEANTEENRGIQEERSAGADQS